MIDIFMKMPSIPELVKDVSTEE